MAAHETGVLVAPPGAGKTVMATALIAKRARSTLVLVHRRPLLEQWISRLAEFLNISTDEIGSPATTPGSSGVDVAMVQTLTRRAGVDLSRYGHVIVDECHHVPAFSVERLLREIPSRAITGLTATPQRRDGHDPIIAMQCGPVRHTLTHSEQIESATRRVLITRDSGFVRGNFPSIRASRRSSAPSPTTTTARDGSPPTPWPSWPRAASRSCSPSAANTST